MGGLEQVLLHFAVGRNIPLSGDNQLVEGKTGRLGNIDQDSPSIHYRPFHRIGNKVVQKAQGLGGGLESANISRSVLTRFLFRLQFLT